ncbi:MAG: site-specific DNA-methyltransferase [Gemmatimonadaceae bacterium]|nr:site-specific DNA-methyltransferase [Gemmatimonadaceae bacterium]
MPLPSQSQLLLPLLATLDERGGALPAKSACDALAERLSLTPEERHETVTLPSGTYSRFDRHVRFVRQRARDLGFIGGEARNLWTLTPAGRNGLRDAQPRVVVTIYETDRGAALFATAESAAQVIQDGSVSLLLTSPPFAMLRAKPYQTVISTDEYVSWLLGLAKEWTRLLSDTGSLVLNLGQCYEPGRPTVSLYREELYLALRKQLGLFLVSDGYWANPSKMPAPAEWVTVRRIRVTGNVEHVYAFAKTPYPAWDNRRCLVPYSDAMQKRLTAGGERGARRPSGHVLAPGAFDRDNGGAIARHLHVAAHTSSRDAYQAFCRAEGLPIHPARFPASLVEHWVKLTTAPGDLVYDAFGGSLTTAEVCERLDRRWLSSERSLTYLAGARPRLANAPGFIDHLRATWAHAQPPVPSTLEVTECSR